MCHCYGDDFIYTVSERASSFTCNAYAQNVSDMGLDLTAPDKSERMSDFITLSKLTLLKRYFVPNTFGGDSNIACGPLEKEVIEEIPRWMHSKATDMDVISTIRAALTLASMWGRTYYDWYVDELRSTTSGNNFLSLLSPEEIFRAKRAPYVADETDAFENPVIAFYMADKNTTSHHRFLSNLANMYSFEHIIDGKDVIVHSVEQAYAMEKAMHYGDKDSFVKIIKSDLPGKCATLSKKVIGNHVVHKAWLDKRLDVMKSILEEKFSVKEYRAMLLNTGKALLIEASPKDVFWGSGLDVLETRTKYNKIQGSNNLGRLLMELRTQYSL